MTINKIKVLPLASFMYIYLFVVNFGLYNFVFDCLSNCVQGVTRGVQTQFGCYIFQGDAGIRRVYPLDSCFNHIVPQTTNQHEGPILYKLLFVLSAHLKLEYELGLTFKIPSILEKTRA